MLRVLLLVIVLGIASPLFSQASQKDTSSFTIAFAEWGGKSMGATCLIQIHGDSITVIHDGNKSLSGKKGDILEKGILRRHKRTGKWIITHDPKDIDAEEVGGCSDGPTEIDLERKIIWFC